LDAAIVDAVIKIERVRAVPVERGPSVPA